MAIILTVEQSLNTQADKLARENKILSQTSRYLIITGVILAALGLILKLLDFKSVDSIYIIGFFLAFIGYGQKVKATHNTKDAGFMRWGKRGEELVTEHLKTKLSDDYYIINDCNITGFSGEKSQIDHLVISPNGLFVIETKNYVGQLSGSAFDNHLTQKKIINNKEQIFKITNPITQNDYHCNILKKYLKLNNIAISDDYIKSVVIFANDKTKIDISNIDNDCVFVGNVYSALEFINNYRPDGKQIDTQILENFIKLFIKDFELKK